MRISMHPAQVRAWGKAADSVGEHVWAQHKKVAAAGDEPAPVEEFEFSAAYTAFFATWTGVVAGLGNTVGVVGANLTASADTVVKHDNDSADLISTWTKRLDHFIGPKRPFYGPTTSPHG